MDPRRLGIEAVALLFITPMFSDSALISIVGFATLFVTRIFDIIDRRIAARDAITRASNDAAALKQHTADQVKVLQSAIQENTELTVTGLETSRAALNEANSTNLKIANATEALAAAAGRPTH